MYMKKISIALVVIVGIIVKIVDLFTTPIRKD